MRSAVVSAALGVALGATDVTPPVVSLSLVDGTPQTSGTVCEVQDATRQSCPLPRCTAHDHHDGDLSEHFGSCRGHSGCHGKSKGECATAQYCYWTGCQEQFFLINDDNTPLTTGNSFDDIRRSLRSEWLVTYDAEDLSGNKAETVSFTFRIEDTKTPILTTSFVTPADEKAGPNGPKTASVSRESCANDSTTAPCTWQLPLAAKAHDAYDLDVTDLIKLKLRTPQGQYVAGSSTAWVLQKDLTELPLDTQNLGDWTLSYAACDKAGMLGLDERDNCWYQTVTIGVSDNTKPIITVTTGQTGSDAWSEGAPVVGTAAVDVLECNVDKYVEAGATCIDLHDSWVPAKGQFVPKASDISGDTVNWQAIDGKTTTNYVVQYDCSDDLGHKADTKTRTVVVRDTRKPVVTLIGDATIENSQGAHKGKDAAWELDTGIHKELLNSQVTCTDECDATPTIVRTLHYGSDCTGELVGNGDVNNFPEYTSGTYSIKYTCSDGTEGDDRTRLTDTTCREIINVDHMHPIIKVLGSDHMTLEATHEGNYIDDGATCSDQVDGVISQNVEVNGDVVNLSRPGTYDVEYNCQDAAGNKAPTAKRIVTVKHTSCPTCYLNGCKNKYDKVSGSSHEKHSTSATRTFEGCHEKHEASFPYTDAGATCTDDIDGALTPEVTNNVDVENVGTYTITYRAKNSVGTWNDESCRGLSVTYVRTVEVIDTLKPVIRLKYNDVEVARGAVTDTGINHEANPAYINGIALGHLMSEEHSSSTDAWLFAAAASAVTGLALLGVSRRRTAAVIAVPV